MALSLLPRCSPRGELSGRWQSRLHPGCSWFAALGGINRWLPEFRYRLPRVGRGGEMGSVLSEVVYSSPPVSKAVRCFGILRLTSPPRFLASTCERDSLYIAERASGILSLEKGKSFKRSCLKRRTCEMSLLSVTCIFFRRVLSDLYSTRWGYVSGSLLRAWNLVSVSTSGMCAY